MNKCFFTMTLFFAFVGNATALVIPINCDGKLIGSINVNTANGSISGGFTTNAALFPTLGDAAKQCGEDHFNWYQIVVKDNKPPVDAGGNRLVAPYVDPPNGGYGNDPTTPGNDTQWADNLPWYYDEGADPAPGTPGFVDGFNLLDNITGNTLSFFDSPGGPAGTILSFHTWLASVNADGTSHGLHNPSFLWDWSNASGTAVASNLRLPEPGSLPLAFLGLVVLFVFRSNLYRRPCV